MSAVVQALDELRRLRESPTWLFAAADPAAVEAALRRGVHELASGQVTLGACEVSKVRVNRNSLTALYRLTIDADAEQPRLVELLGEIVPPGESAPEVAAQNGPIGTEGWRRYVPELRVALRTKPPDVALPVLPILTGPESARALLERGIRNGSSAYADFRIETCTPQVMRYKPGSRCTVLYRLEFPSELEERGWPNPVVAKTHHGAKGRNAYEGMKALWSSKLRTTSAVRIAEPLAFLAEENVVLQGPVPGDVTLGKLIESALEPGDAAAIDALSHYIGQTGVGLAELHTCGVTSGEVVTWADEVAELQARILRLAEFEPGVAAATGSILRRLEAEAARHPVDRTAPCHRSFRPAQVLLDDGAIGFIDFDGFCQAEPALDLALFRATLKDLGMRALPRDRAGREARAEQLATVDRLCAAFLERYETVAPASRARVALWEALDLLSLVVNCWKKVKPGRLEHRLELLARHLRESGLE